MALKLAAHHSFFIIRLNTLMPKKLMRGQLALQFYKLCMEKEYFNYVVFGDLPCRTINQLPNIKTFPVAKN